jgi:anti-sigma regulatory factor (Ser/Thr protein kinase)
MRPQPFVLASKVVGAAGCGWLMSAMEMAALASGNWPLRADPGPLSWTCFPRVATRRMGGDARSVQEARDFTIATVQRWGAAERYEDIAVVVSELVTNALRHGRPDSGSPSRWPIRLGMVKPGSCVLCAVADPSTKPPVPEEQGYLAETGRGLQVIDALSDQWGFTMPGGIGKVVWALFATLP